VSATCTATPPPVPTSDVQAIGEDIAAPPRETIPALRAAVSAAAALARLDEAVARSPVGASAAAAFELLDVAGCIALDQVPLDTATLLSAPPGARDPAVQRELELRELARAESIDGIGVPLLLALGARENGGREGVRARAVGVRERATLMPGVKLPRGETRLLAGMAAWTSLLARRGRDVQSLVLIAAAHRRWLALRPFAAGNVRLAQLLDALLLRGEGLTRCVDLPLARWFARRTDTYRVRLHAGASDEPSWICWWLDGVSYACEETLEQLVAWERLHHALETHPAMARAEPAAAALPIITRPQFEQQEAMVASELSRTAANRWLESLVDDGVLRPLSGTRERRYANVGVLRLLLESTSS